ncbi:MAG: hypothetical protein GY940_08625, partial [bacterium]|nr:hypothetical protein [bacterium]
PPPSDAKTLRQSKTRKNKNPPGIYLKKALQAAQWLEANIIRQPGGTVWAADPAKPDSIIFNLYSGTPGVILFFLETYYATGKKHYLEIAGEAANRLLNWIDSPKKEVYYGLYVGLSGVGFVLDEVYNATGQEKYRKGAAQCIRLIRENAQIAGKGIQWNSFSDLIIGSTGTGLFLLHMAKKTSDPELVQLAAKAGKRLIELGIPVNGGLKWRMSTDPQFKRTLPNFSHGTAGIAYYLATLYRHTHKKEFLDAALAGAKYLLSIAKTDGGSCLVFHNEPGGKDRYYLSWCHGPPGTARLFYRLYQITRDKTWMDWVRKSARGILDSGIPGRQTPGFWNNAGWCCGSAGVADFFLQLYRVTHQQTYLDFSRQMTEDLLKKSTAAGKGLKWIHAEHRVKPGLLKAQTGLMQGAAGIGLWLLRLDAFEKRKQARIVFPDSPY